MQQWMENGQKKWFEGQVMGHSTVTDEFELKYIAEDAPSFMTVHELLADVITGDFEIHH